MIFVVKSQCTDKYEGCGSDKLIRILRIIVMVPAPLGPEKIGDELPDDINESSHIQFLL